MSIRDVLDKEGDRLKGGAISSFAACSAMYHMTEPRSSDYIRPLLGSDGQQVPKVKPFLMPALDAVRGQWVVIEDPF